MLTLAQMREDLRVHLDEITARYWQNDELDRAIYDAAKDIARRGEVLLDTHTIRTKAGQHVYDFPPDLLRIHRVEYQQSDTNSFVLEFLPPLQMDDYWVAGRTATQGTPSHFTVWGFSGDSQQLRIYPAPSDQANIVLWYYRLPRKPVNDGDPVEVPSGWEDLIPLYAEYVALRKDRDGRWREAFELYMERLDSLIKMTRHLTDQADYFSMSSWFQDEDWYA